MTLRRPQLRLPLAAAALTALVALSSGLGVGGAAGQAGSPLLTIGVDVKAATSDQVTYELVVRNHGTGTASGVQVDNAIPANTGFRESSPAPTSATCQNGGAEESSGTCSWALPNLGPGGEAKIVLTLALAVVDTNYTVTDSASVTATGVTALSDSDDSLHRHVITGNFDLDDTYVDDTKPANTSNGNCQTLEISRDGSRTAFLTSTAEDWPLSERLWGVQARAYVGVAAGQPAGTPTTLGLHRIEQRWDTSAKCNATTLLTDEPRTGWTPPSSVTPTAVAAYSGAPAPATPNTPPDLLVWNVLPDVDTQARRDSFEGWEILDEGSGGVSLLKSVEASPYKPQVVLVYTKAEPPTCVDSDPESANQGSHHEAVLTAQVTDGTRLSSGGADGCTGGPAGAGERVGWRIEDDDPDTYVSSVNGAVASLHANAAAAPIDGDGRSAIGIRMAQPNGTEGTNAGATGVSAGAPFAADPDNCVSQPTDPPCARAESDGEDDATVAWTFEPAPPPESDPPGTGTPPPTDGDPAPGEPSSPGATPADRSLEAFTRRRITWGRTARITGRVGSPVAACRERAEVSLLARASTADAWAAVARVESDRDGAFALETIVKSSREYQLSLPPTSACAAADAGPFTITPTGSVRLVVGQLALHRGERTTLSGQVLPRSRGTRVTLQRATRGGWKRVARTRLDRRSRYRFTVRATWLGRRTFRVRWAGRPPQYGPAVSRRARLLSRRG